MGAWMKSENTGKFYLTEDDEVYEDVPPDVAGRISDSHDFKAALCSPKAIMEEIARTKARRAAKEKRIVDAVLAGVASGITVTADVDYARIAAETEAALADEFAAVTANIDDQPTEFKVTPA